jgi:hypothetical protein
MRASGVFVPIGFWADTIRQMSISQGTAWHGLIIVWQKLHSRNEILLDYSVSNPFVFAADLSEGATEGENVNPC